MTAYIAKEYQNQVLESIQTYFDACHEYTNASTAFWNSAGDEEMCVETKASSFLLFLLHAASAQSRISQHIFFIVF